MFGTIRGTKSGEATLIQSLGTRLECRHRVFVRTVNGHRGNLLLEKNP